MPSITTWTRLEPAAGDNLAEGMRGRVYDPLWLLARQWQMGEFRAEDAGSPVFAEIEGAAFSLTRYLAGPLPATAAAAGRRFDVAEEPLETLVEKEPVLRGAVPDLRFAADAGRHFLRLLDSAGMARYRAAYQARYALKQAAPADDAPAAALLDLLAGRVIDGTRLYADVRAALRPASGTPALPDAPVIEAADRNEVRSAAEAWIAWYEAQAAEPERGEDTWIDDRLEYAFAVSAATSQGEVVLSSAEYAEGRLDWDAFTIRSGARLGAEAGEMKRETVAMKIIPAPVSYPGMPGNRWWEFEDARVQFGAVQPSPQDLASLVFLQFALIYGNDWFVIPVELPVGTLTRITALKVTDSFGVVTAVQPFHEAGGTGTGWRMFTPSSTPANPPAPRQDYLLLAPAVLTPAESGAIEEVLFLRDEMANLAWAVEHRVESRSGDVIDRAAVYNAAHPAEETLAAAVAGSGMLAYRLATSVPDYWVPLVPGRDAEGALRLRRGVVPHPERGTPEARGRILTPGTPLPIHDEEIPRSGAHVTRSWQSARWLDGTTHVWVGRKKEPGRGEGSSGLRFDTLEPPKP